MMQIEIMRVAALCATGIIAISSMACSAAGGAAVKNIPGEVLVLDRAEAVAPWNTKALGGNSVTVATATDLVREGAASIRWKCVGHERERFGFAVPKGKRDWSAYDQVQFWCYSAKHTAAAVYPMVQDKKGEYRAGLRINWEGWRLITISKKDLGKDWSWADVPNFGSKVDWKNVRNFGFEEHSYRELGFYPVVDTDLRIDSVVLTKRILAGTMRNEIGTQSGPFVYVVRVKNLSDQPRTCRISTLQQRGPDPANEVGVEVTPSVLNIRPGGTASAKVTFTVPPERIARPQTLRGLVVSVYATLEGHAVPQLEFRIPCQRFYYDSLDVKHPRLYVDDKRLAEIKQLIESDERVRKMWEGILKSADSALTSTVGQSKDGRQRLYKGVELAFAYRMTGKKKYADRVRKYVEMALKWEALNAERKPTSPRKTNLATGHNVMNLGIMYDWLYDVWTPEERKALRGLIVEKGLKAHYTDCRIRYVWGHPYDSNWSAVVSGGVGVGALAVLGDEPDASRWAEFGTQRIERIAESQGIDGGNAEGTSYWNYNMRYCDFYADALRTATGGKYNLFRLQPFYYKTCYYYLGTLMPEGQWANFADAWHAGNYKGPIETPSLNDHFLRMASEFKDGYLQWKARTSGGGLFGLFWYDPSVKQVAKETRPLATVYRGSQFAVLRGTNEGVDGVAMAMRAGSNSEGHGHFDILNFVVSGYGYQLAADRGPSQYGAPGYFGFTRHKNALAATFAHNCILVDGEVQIWGREVQALYEQFFHSPVADYLQADGSKVYPPELLNKWKRHVLFVRPRYFIMWDEMTSPKPVDYEWRMHTWSEQRDTPQTIPHGAIATTHAYNRRPDKAAQIKIGHAAWPDPHKTVIDRIPYDPKVHRNDSDKRRGFFVKTTPAGAKTDKWTLLTMLFPVDKADSEGRGEFEPIEAEGALAVKIGDAKKPGGPDTVVVSLTEGAVEVGAIRLQGRAAMVSGEKVPRRYALVLGTKLASGEADLISSDRPVTAAFELKGRILSGSIQASQETEVKLFTGRATKVRLTINGELVEATPRRGLVSVKVPASNMAEFLSHQDEKIGYQTYE